MWFILGLVGELRKKLFRLLLQAFYLRFFSIDSINHALTTGLNHRVQTKVSPLKDFFKKPYTCIYFCHHTVIYSFGKCFFLFKLCLWTRDFFAFCKIFSTSHIAQGIIELISWTQNSYIQK